MDVNEELKLLWKCKKIGEGRGWGGGVRSGRGWGLEGFGLVAGVGL